MKKSNIFTIDVTSLGFIKVTDNLYTKSSFILKQNNTMTWDFILIDVQLENGFHLYKEGFFLNESNIGFINQTIRNYKIDELLR